MIYLDNSATTSTDPDIAAIALDFMTNRYGNPSSLHHFGMDAYQAVMNARYQTARLIGAPTDSVYFTSGGTESNNIAIRGTALANQALGRHIVTTTIEHSSVLSCCQALEKEGFSVTYVAPSPETHRIEAQDILRAVREDTILISMMHVNNETGEVLPVREVAEAVHREHPHTLIHCDTVQSLYATFCAALPLTPASTSSKISVGTPSCRASTCFMASMILASSPPEATLESGLSASPTFADIKKRTPSMPVGESGISSN